MRQEFIPYVKLVEFLGNILGENTEVVLHDVTNLNQSIIAISNGCISGRELGGPATNLILETLKDAKYRDKDYLCDYPCSTSKGVVLKSSTFFIHDKRGEIIGMLCINTNCEPLEKARSIIDSLIRPFSSEGGKIESARVQPKTAGKPDKGRDGISEVLSLNVDELTIKSIRDVVDKTGISPDRMSQQEKMDVVRALYDRGIFNLKGAVSMTSSVLKISDPSVYRYLNHIKSEINLKKRADRAVIEPAGKKHGTV